MNQWVRLDVNFHEAEWILGLSDSAQLAWVKLICYVKLNGYGRSGAIEFKSKKSLAYALRTFVPVIEELLELATSGDEPAIEITENQLTLCNWDNFQNPDVIRKRSQKVEEEPYSAANSGNFRKLPEMGGNSVTRQEPEQEPEQPEKREEKREEEKLKQKEEAKKEEKKPGSETSLVVSSASRDYDDAADPPGEILPSRGKKPPDQRGARVIEHLNLQAGRKFRVDGAGVGFINARLKDGASEAELCLVIDHRAQMWGTDGHMRQYLRPETLFCRTHWEGYLMAAQEWEARGREPPVKGPRKESLSPLDKFRGALEILESEETHEQARSKQLHETGHSLTLRNVGGPEDIWEVDTGIEGAG